MIQEEKELLLKDLCARLSYEVMVECSIECGESIDLILSTSHIDELVNNSLIVKPYLRPISSITEEESDELESIIFPLMKKDWEGNENPACIRAIDIPKYMDFILSHHFDYCGLIEKGLALEAPKDMYKI